MLCLGCHWVVVVLESQFVQTVLALVVGAYLIQKLHDKTNRDVETLRWLINKVDEYEKTAFEYWKAHYKNLDTRIALAATLKVEGFFIYTAVSIASRIPSSERIRVQMLVSEMWAAATGGEFEGNGPVDEHQYSSSIQQIAKAVRAIKMELFKHL